MWTKPSSWWFIAKKPIYRNLLGAIRPTKRAPKNSIKGASKGCILNFELTQTQLWLTDNGFSEKHKDTSSSFAKSKRRIKIEQLVYGRGNSTNWQGKLTVFATLKKLRFVRSIGGEGRSSCIRKQPTISKLGQGCPLNSCWRHWQWMMPQEPFSNAEPLSISS